MRTLLVAIALVASVLAADKARMMTGEVVSLDAPERILVVRNEVAGTTEDVRFLVAPDAVVRVHGLKGKLDRIKTGDIVTVTYVVQDGVNVATAVSHM